MQYDLTKKRWPLGESFLPVQNSHFVDWKIGVLSQLFGNFDESFLARLVNLAKEYERLAVNKSFYGKSGYYIVKRDRSSQWKPQCPAYRMGFLSDADCFEQKAGYGKVMS